VSKLLSIGDFSRATQLSIKALRHYQDEGLLEPTEIDSVSGYRRYALDLVPRAQVIRRLRGLGMPIGEVREVLSSADVAGRNELISRHLRRLQRELVATQASVAALQQLLENPIPSAPIEHRAIPATRAAAIVEDVAIGNAAAWLAGALGELYAVLDGQGVVGGAAGGIYADELFALERGRATVYLPVRDTFTASGRIQSLEIPAAELAVIGHSGPHEGIDRDYGALAEYVTRHELAVDGPIREFYPVNRHQTADQSKWRTEIGWPVFRVS